MQFDEWRPAYEAILADFGYDRVSDERARDELATIVGHPSDADEGVRESQPGRRAIHPLGLPDLQLAGTVAICGAAPSLAEELSIPADADRVVAASTAAVVLREAGIGVDCMVTDLDGDPATARSLTAAGTPVAVHAHGDNLAAIREHVPRFEVGAVLPTTQAAPRGPVVNPGGFTDGDRAAFLADEVGADRLVFAGWRFDDPAVDAAKARKLLWAERLLHWLERRRDERFAILDGRRDRIELPWL